MIVGFIACHVPYHWQSVDGFKNQIERSDGSLNHRNQLRNVWNQHCRYVYRFLHD